MKNLLSIFIAVLIGASCSLVLHGQEAATISVQGILKDANGASVPDGNYAVIFRLFNQETGGSPVWQEEATVEVIGGIYTHYLGGVTPLNAANFANVLYLGLKVGNYELNPRTKMTHAPYTFSSDVAQRVVCSGAVGDIKYSILNPTQFAAMNGDCWVPLDGRPLSQSDMLRQVTGLTNLPNAGGLFIRSQEFENSANDPGRDVSTAIATIQGDEVKSHAHTMQQAGLHSHGVQDATGGTGFQIPVKGMVNGLAGATVQVTDQGGAHVHTIDAAGGPETRPKNINFWVYIRTN